MSTLGDFCRTALGGDFVGSALGDRGCDCAHGCSFLPHTFSVKLSGISGFLVWHKDAYGYGPPVDRIEPFDLSICNRNYSVSLPAWREPTCSSVGLSPYIGPLLWFHDDTYGDTEDGTYVQYWLQLDYYATPEGNQIVAQLEIGVTPFSESSNGIVWRITLPWTEDDCCHGIGRNLPKVAAYPINPPTQHGAHALLSPGTGDGSICTIMS